jgi:hypothetical protein
MDGDEKVDRKFLPGAYLESPGEMQFLGFDTVESL